MMQVDWISWLCPHLREGTEAEKSNKGVGTIHGESDEVDANVVMLSMSRKEMVQFLDGGE